MAKIKKIKGRQVFDSRGNPTVEAEIFSDEGYSALAIVPSGASTGTHEAFELRDKDNKKYLGKSVFKAVKAVGMGGGKVALDGMKTIDSAVNFAADKVAATKAVQGLQKGLIKVDSFLDKYPKLKTASGVAIAGFLTYQWLYMSFSGNLDSDYDLSSIPEAVAGNIGFTEILATPQGVKGMGLLAAGLATGGLSTLWLGGRKGMMMAAAYTGAKKLGDKKTENKLFTKMRQFIKGDAGEVDDKDREPDDPEVR